MDQADQELRAAIQKSWPTTRGGNPPMVDLLVPPPEETGPGKLTVGKIYGGMLILENWKLSRFGQGFNNNKNNSHSNNIPVTGILFQCSDRIILISIMLQNGHGNGMVNNNNVKNVDQNEKSLLDAPVPSPTPSATGIIKLYSNVLLLPTTF